MSVDGRAISIFDYAKKSLAEGVGGDLVRSVAYDIVYLYEKMSKAEEKRDELRRGADGLIDAGTEFIKERDAAWKALSAALDRVSALEEELADSQPWRIP